MCMISCLTACLLATEPTSPIGQTQCSLILKIGLCAMNYFRSMCCETCNAFPGLYDDEYDEYDEEYDDYWDDDELYDDDTNTNNDITDDGNNSYSSVDDNEILSNTTAYDDVSSDGNDDDVLSNDDVSSDITSNTTALESPTT